MQMLFSFSPIAWGEKWIWRVGWKLRSIFLSQQKGETGQKSIHGRVPRRNPLLTKRKEQKKRGPQKLFSLLPRSSWSTKVFYGLTRQKLTFWKADVCYIWTKNSPAVDKKSIVTTVSWAGFTASGSGRLPVMNAALNSDVYQKVLEDRRPLWPSVHDLAKEPSCSRAITWKAPATPPLNGLINYQPIWNNNSSSIL